MTEQNNYLGMFLSDDQISLNIQYNKKRFKTETLDFNETCLFDAVWAYRFPMKKETNVNFNTTTSHSVIPFF